jgi:hypothetical protein
MVGRLIDIDHGNVFLAVDHGADADNLLPVHGRLDHLNQRIAPPGQQHRPFLAVGLECSLRLIFGRFAAAASTPGQEAQNDYD